MTRASVQARTRTKSSSVSWPIWVSAKACRLSLPARSQSTIRPVIPDCTARRMKAGSVEKSGSPKCGLTRTLDGIVGIKAQNSFMPDGQAMVPQAQGLGSF